MEKNSVETVVRALNEKQVQYLIVGGVAVVAHGYTRFTADLDLVLAMDRENLAHAVSSIKSLGYRPRVPVAFEEFIEPDNRGRWKSEKNMLVFSLFSPTHPMTNIDLFLEPPFDFAAAYSRVMRLEVVTGVAATFCSLDDLIAMKKVAARGKDLLDVAQLERRKKP